MLEKDIENSILDYLKLKNIFCWKNQSVGIYDKQRGAYRKPRGRHHLNGVCDIIGMYNGMALFIEVKTPKTKTRVSQDQKYFIRKIKEHGGIAFVAASIDDVIKGLEEHG